MAIVQSPPDLLLDARASLGEGPVWNHERGELLWVDIDAGLVRRTAPSGDCVGMYAAGQPVGIAVPRVGGGLAVALRDGFGLLDDDGRFSVVAPIEMGNLDTRLNDGACDSRGRFWAGSLSLSNRPNAALYRWVGDREAVRLLDGVTISNGIGWSPDDRTMYYVDTTTRRVDAFDFDAESGRIAHRRTLVEIEAGGKPDGLTVDADGCLWIALWGGAAVHRYTPDGTLERCVPLPVTQVTSCCFGGNDLRTLFVTTAARGMNEPYAGGLFACAPNCDGMPTAPFAG